MKGLKAPSVLPIPIGGSSKEFTNWLFLREAASHALREQSARGWVAGPHDLLWQVAAVVGHEDGADQALNDVGLTSRPIAYWVGEAMGSTNFVDLAKVPKLGTKSNIQASAAEIALLRSAKVFPYIQ